MLKRALTTMAGVLPLVALGHPSEAADLLVPGDFPTIQSAIDGAVDGDVVRVASGTYFENIDFLGKAITVESLGGPGVTVIDAGGAGSVVQFDSGEGRASVLRGFTITNGFSFSDAGGVNIEFSAPTIEGNFILDNRGCSGIGIRSYFSSPLILNNLIESNLHQGCTGGAGAGISVGGTSSAEIVGNTITNNHSSSGDGGGISLFASGPARIEGNVISNNSASGTSASAGGGLWIVNDSPALIVQNLIYGNSSDIGGGIYLSVPSGAGVPAFFNNTVADNTALEGSALWAAGLGVVSNNILTGSGSASALHCGFGAEDPTIISYNDVFNPSGNVSDGLCPNLSGLGINISSDPLFVDAAAGDYHLMTGSPAIDSGNGGFGPIPLVDFDGTPRLADGDGDGNVGLDMGAFERPAATSGTPDAGTDAGPVDAEPVDSGQMDAGTLDTGVPDTGVSDSGVADSGAPDTGGQAVLFVPDDYPTIQAAINAASDGDSVRVAPGMYFENIDFIGKAITVQSQAGPDATIIHGSNAGSVVAFRSGEGRSSILRGFTITRGHSDDEGGGVHVENASPTIENNRILLNSGCTGTGIMSQSSSPLIRSNLIAENVTSGCPLVPSGAGLHISDNSDAEVISNIISGNQAFGTGGGIVLDGAGDALVQGNVISDNATGFTTLLGNGGGIAILNDSPARILQNVIYGNRAIEGGGIYLFAPSGGSGPTILNNTVVDNSASTGSAVQSDGYDALAEISNNIFVGSGSASVVSCTPGYDNDSPILSYNDVFDPSGVAYGGICVGLTGVNGNISADPSFVDPAASDFHLMAGSLAIDSGNGGLSQLPGIDFDGNGRIADGDGDGLSEVDMGAYEHPDPSGTPDAGTDAGVPDTGSPDGGGSVSGPRVLVVGTSAERSVNDFGGDGTFEELWNECYRTLNIRRIDGSVRTRSLLAFDLRAIPPENAILSASFGFHIASVSSGPDVGVLAYGGDGVLTLADSTTPAQLVGQYSPQSSGTGPSVIPLDAQILAGVAAGWLELRLQYLGNNGVSLVQPTGCHSWRLGPRLIVTHAPRPEPVRALTALATDGSVVLEWANPFPGSDYSTMIRYSTTDYPADETDGTLLVDRTGGATDRFVHVTANGTQVFYTAFVHLNDFFGEGVTTQATPRSTNGPLKRSYTTGATNLEPPGIGFGEVVGVSNDNLCHNLTGGLNGGTWRFAPVTLNDVVMHRPTVSPYPVGPASSATFVSTPDGFVNAIDGTDGSAVWTSPNLGMVMGAPSISFSQFGGTDEVFVGSRVAGGVSALYALDLDTGVENWRFDAGGLGTGIISGQVQVDQTNSRVFFGSRARQSPGDPTLWCVSHAGQVPVQVWAVDVGDVDGSPILADGRIYVGNTAGELVAVDAVTGAELWRLDLGDGPIKDYVAVNFGTNELYMSTSNTLWSITDNTNGGSPPPAASINWSITTIPNPSTPFVGGGRVWVGSGDGRLYQIDQDGTGLTWFQVAPAGTALGSPGVEVSANLFHMGAENGVLYSVEVPLP